MIDIAARFGDNLVRLRKQADLSRDELSIRASVHRTEVSHLERGLRILPHRHAGQANGLPWSLRRRSP